MSDYFKMLQAVENYYGAGSDQWLTMANWTGYTSAQVAQILKQTPGINIMVNEAGEMVGYSLETAASTMTAAEASAAAAANAINSNALTATAVKQQLSIAPNAVAGATAGTVQLSSGATKVATGSAAKTALGHIGTWVLGAGVGLKLGVWIDAGLYEGTHLTPWNWDDMPEEYNPENWKDYKVTNWLYDNSGYDYFTAHFNADDEQLYVDQELFALAAQYLASQGFFARTSEYVERGDISDSKLYYPENIDDILPIFISPAEINFTDNGSRVWYSNNTKPVYNVIWHRQLVQYSEEPFKCHFLNEGVVENINDGVLSTAKDGTQFYKYQWNARGIDGTTNGVYNDGFPTNYDDLGYVVLFGDHEIITPPDGVHQYDTMPRGITPTMTLADLLTLLQTQYPDLFNEKIKQGVLNNDGTITDHYYLPIGLPSGGEEGKPETDPEHPGQVNPDNPTTVEIITRIINPTPDPTPNPTEPDPGKGTTPTIVPPTGTASALYKIYNPTEAEIQSFGSWLWSSNFVDQLLKIFNDPMQAIISLHKIYGTPSVGGRANIKVGYLDSGVESNWVDEQYIDVDCGEVNINEKNANVYDYAPFVDIRIYLPFIGIVPLDTADVMRGKVGVTYRIDVLTGTLVASVSITRDGGAGGVIYQYTGSCAEQYPLSSGSYMGIVTGMLGIAAGVAGTIATGGAAAPALLGGAAGLTAMHTKVEHSNGFSGNAGALACKKPYLIISRAQRSLPNGTGSNIGWPANSLIRLSQCSGYTRVKAIHLSGIDGATDTELRDIETLLKNGVII